MSFHLRLMIFANCLDPDQCCVLEPICKNGAPLKDASGVDLFCGRGLNHVDCPLGSVCVISPIDLYAKCCLSGGKYRGTPVATCTYIFGLENEISFVCFDSLRPLNNLSVIRDGSSWVEPVLG